MTEKIPFETFRKTLSVMTVEQARTAEREAFEAIHKRNLSIVCIDKVYVYEEGGFFIEYRTGVARFYNPITDSMSATAKQAERELFNSWIQ